MNARTAHQATSEERLFLHGIGQAETRTAVLSDGRQNTHPHAGQLYRGITGREIARMVRDPAAVAKDAAPWFIPSTYRESDGRGHDAQRAHGVFWWLALDCDRNDLAIEDVAAALEAVAPGASRLVYATRSSKPGDRRWRGLVPLAQPIPGADYADTANAFHDLLEQASTGTLIADRALARPGQLVYLPNRGEHYEHEIRKGHPLLLGPDHPITVRREAIRAERAEAQREAAEARRQRAERRREQASDGETPVGAFNARHSVAQLLERYGYRNGGGDDWRSPMQQSGSYATRDCGEFWISLSGSDAAAGIGAATRSGHRWGDAFDLFVHYEHGGDFAAAVRNWAEENGLARPSKADPDMSDGEHGIGGGNACKEPDGDDHKGGTGPRGGPRTCAPDLTEDGVALAFTAKHRDLLRFDHDRGRWFKWDGDRWKEDGTGLAFEWCRKMARDASDGAKPKEIATARKASFAAGVERFARTDRAHAVTAEIWNRDPWALGVPGGVVDLRTGKMRPPRQDDHITKQAAMAPYPAMQPVRWLTFLDEATGGDAGMIRFIRQWFGYCLTGVTTEHALVFVYGPGGNGKSVLSKVLSRLMGDYAATAPMDALMATRGERHSTDLAMLAGARLVTASETEEGRAWAEARIKQMTGGDPITARYMRQDNFTFFPQFKLLIAGNHKPALHNVDDAMRRRFNILPFTRTPASPDGDLEEKMMAEAPGILAWAIGGCLDWQVHGLLRPDSVREATAEYFDDNDLLGQWLADRCHAEPGNLHRWETSAKLFADWTEYARAAGEDPGSATRFGDRMRRRGFERSTKKIFGSSAKVWLGIELRSPPGGFVNKED